jgi:hypothetical protein
MGAEEIRKNNPVVMSEKVQKIWTTSLLHHSNQIKNQIIFSPSLLSSDYYYNTTTSNKQQQQTTHTSHVRLYVRTHTSS